MDKAGPLGWTPIYVAADKGHVEVVRELLNRGAKMDIAYEFLSSPLCAAAEKGHLEVVRELLNRGAGMDIAYEFTFLCSSRKRPLGICPRVAESCCWNGYCI